MLKKLLACFLVSGVRQIYLTRHLETNRLCGYYIVRKIQQRIVDMTDVTMMMMMIKQTRRSEIRKISLGYN